MILTLLIQSEISSTWTEAEAHVTTTKNKYKTHIHNYLTYYTPAPYIKARIAHTIIVSVSIKFS